jgi:hypothetical protein
MAATVRYDAKEMDSSLIFARIDAVQFETDHVFESSLEHKFQKLTRREVALYSASKFLPNAHLSFYSNLSSENGRTGNGGGSTGATVHSSWT